MKLLRTLASSFLIITTVALFMSGCKTTTTETPPVDNTPVRVYPKAGSKYTYAKHQRDSASGKAAITVDSMIVASIFSTNTTFQGKDSVTTVYDDKDTLQYRVESNLDVSVYKSNFGSSGFVFNNPTPWMTLPFGSKKTGVVLFTHDTTISVSGQNEKLTITGTVDYIGTDELDTGTTHAKMASGPQAKVTISIVGTSPVPVTITSTQTYSFDFYTTGNYFHSISDFNFPDVKFFGSTLLAGSTSHTEKIMTTFSLIK
ncbi:MAG: hypothetical protein WCH46_03770 [bacterium]